MPKFTNAKFGFRKLETSLYCMAQSIILRSSPIYTRDGPNVEL